MATKHAQVLIDGKYLPLIGIAPSATLETCNGCGAEENIALMKWDYTGRFLWCVECQIDVKHFIKKSS